MTSPTSPIQSIDKILAELEAINKPKTGLLGYLPQTKQALLEYFESLIGEDLQEKSFYGSPRDKAIAYNLAKKEIRERIRSQHE